MQPPSLIDTPASLLQRLSHRPQAEDWERFVRLFTPLLLGWARRSGVPEDQAEDLLQDVFLLLFRKLPAFAYDPNQSFRAWLATVFRHAVANRFRGQWPNRATAEQLAELESPAAAAEFVEADYRRYLLERALTIVRTDFPETSWRIFRLLAIEGRPGVEVARELGTTANAVYLVRSRILARLREELAGLEP